MKSFLKAIGHDDKLPTKPRMDKQLRDMPTYLLSLSDGVNSLANHPLSDQ